MEIQREAWLNLTKEEPLEPELPIIDPHHHLWDYPDSFTVSQVRESARPLRHYLLDNLMKDISSSGHKFVQTLFMECGSMYRKDGPPELRCLGETEFVQGIAAQSASGQYGKTQVAAGIVGFADLMLGSAVARVLEAQIQTSRRFRGIRFTTVWDASPAVSSRVTNPDLLGDKTLREGFAELHKHNLTFDAWLYFHQMPGLADLAKAFPDTPIIMNHIGGPLGVGPYAGKREEVLNEWKKGIELVAKYPNVVVKLGGMGMPRTGFRWDEMPKPPDSAELAKQMGPYYLFCIEKFGTKRCMFESNFPVDKVSFSYGVIWNTFKKIVKDFSPSEKADLFFNTASKTYKLPPITNS